MIVIVTYLTCLWFCGTTRPSAAAAVEAAAAAAACPSAADRAREPVISRPENLEKTTDDILSGPSYASLCPVAKCLLIYGRNGYLYWEVDWKASIGICDLKIRPIAACVSLYMTLRTVSCSDRRRRSRGPPASDAQLPLCPSTLLLILILLLFPILVLLRFLLLRCCSAVKFEIRWVQVERNLLSSLLVSFWNPISGFVWWFFQYIISMMLC